jgi:uncharacterized protein YegL
MGFCGLYTSSNAPVPLEGTHVEARIIDLIAEVNVLQFYVNTEDAPIEARYIFPLDSNAAVCDFQYEINGKIVQSVVKEKQQAKQDYNNAIARGDGAALLEQEKADIFQISVGNIPPSTRVNVKITYVVEMANEDDFVKFLLPTTIAPRYIPPGHSSYYTSSTYRWVPYYRPWNRLWCDCFHWDRYGAHFVEVQGTHVYHHPHSSNTQVMQAINSSQQHSSEIPFALSLYLRVEMPSDILEIVSPTHQIQSTKETEKIFSVMFLKDSEALDKDVVIKIKTSSPHQPRAVLEESTTLPEASGSVRTGSAVMLTLVPQFVLNDIQAEFIFIVDRSGSMSGSKMTQTRSALQLFLRALPANSYFNIIGFGSSHQSLFTKSQPYEESYVEKALEHAKNLQANLGGTELMAPLRAVYSSSSEKGYSRQIFVLTDGEVSNTEEVVRLVQENHRRNSEWRLFTIGVGSSVSHALVEGMARGGRGSCQIIGDSERLEPKVMSQLKQALQPALTNLRVDWGGSSPAASTPAPSAPKTGFATMAPKIGSLLGHRIDEKLPPHASVAARNDLVYQAPFILPPVYSNKRFICYAYLHPSVNVDKITLTAESPDGPLDVILPIERTTGLTIHRLAARALIRDLEEGSSHLHYGSSIRPAEEVVKKEIVELGVKFNLSSKHTSFVAIDDRSEERRQEDWLFSHISKPVIQPIVRSVGIPACRGTPPREYKKLCSPRGSGAPRNPAMSAGGGRGGGAGGAGGGGGGQVFSSMESSSSSARNSWDSGSRLSAAPAPATPAPAGAPCAPCAPSSSSSSSLASTQRSKSPRDVLNSILDLQKLSGAFEASSALASILSLPLSEVQTPPSSLSFPSLDSKIWSTALVIGYLEKVLGALKDEWELVGDKSKSWINAELKKLGVESTQLNADILVRKAIEVIE